MSYDASQVEMDLAEFDSKAAAKGDLEAAALTNGPYVLEVVSKGVYFKSKVREDGKGGTKTIKLPCIVVTSPGGTADGGMIAIMRFLSDQSKFNKVLEDFKKLGFDSDDWNNPAKGRVASKELLKALAAVAGIRIKVNKFARGDFHDFEILGRGTGDGKPAKFTQADLEAAAKDEEEPWDKAGAAAAAGETVGAGAGAGAGDSSDGVFN